MISKPGIYYDMATADYFSDPCPSPSLTQSLAKVLLERSPLHAWYEHPRLNPDFKADNDTKFDVGNVAHKLMLGRGKEVVVLNPEFEDWRTKAAREAREQAAKEGKLCVLVRHMKVAQKMVDIARDRCEAVGCHDAFHPDHGKGEVVIAWEEGGIWFRSMIDWFYPFSQSLSLLYDYKTTGMSVAPHVIGRMMADAGWDIQAAMHERGLVALDLIGRGSRFRFVAQENEPPYAVTVAELSESVLTMGRKKLEVAIRIWRKCIKTNRFPGYPAQIIVPEYPGYAEAQWLDREQTEFAGDLVMAG